MGMTFKFNGLSEMLPDVDKVAIEMAEAAGPILVESTKNAVRRVVKHEGDSELVNSIKTGTPKKDKYGDYVVKASPTGTSKNKFYAHTRTKRGKYAVSNALKAIWKEYGIPSRGIPAQPFIEAATRAAESEALDKMQEVFNARVSE